MTMKRICAAMGLVGCLLFLLTACGQTPVSPDESLPQDASTTTEETTTTAANANKVTEVATATKEGIQAGASHDDTTTASVPITTNVIPRPSAEAGASTSKSTAKSAYVPSHLSQNTTDDTSTTTTGTTGTTKDHTLPTMFTEEDRCPEVRVWTDKEVYGLTDKVTIYVLNLSDNTIGFGNEFWLWEQVEGGWKTVHDKNGRMMMYVQASPTTPDSHPIPIGMKLTDYDLKPNTRYMAGDLVYTSEGERWIGVQFITAEE